jgi:hypothetical protein
MYAPIVESKFHQAGELAADEELRADSVAWIVTLVFMNMNWPKEPPCL